MPKRQPKAPISPPLKGSADQSPSAALVPGRRAARADLAPLTDVPATPALARRRKAAGRPPFKATPELRARVELLTGLGLRQEDLVLLIDNPTTGQPIDLKTLRFHFRTELDRGVVKANAKVAKSLFERATDLQHPQGAACSIFWAKARMGWRETAVVEVVDKSGVLVSPAQISPEEWIDRAAARARTLRDPGEETA